jgi:polyhydroxyalkanoate synthesis regulator phasin
MANSKLPHGMVPISDIKDVSVKKVIMKLNENIKALEKRVVELEKKG